MSITAVDATTESLVQASTDANNTLGKMEFLEMLIAQLQNQDPLNPADSTEFTAQLAQFSSLEQMANMNTTLERMETALGGNTNTQAVSYIGKVVLAEGNSLRVGSEGADSAMVSLDADASELYVNIYDGAGNLVRRLNAGEVKAGDQAIAWDGRNSAGDAVDPGLYTYEIQAVDADGSSLDAQTYVSGTVYSVGYEDAEAYLNLNGREVPVTDVVQVMDAAAEE